MCIQINRKTIKEHERDREERKEGRKAQPLFPKQVNHRYLPLTTGLSIFIFFSLISYFPQNSTSTPLHDKNTQQTKTVGNFLDLINSIYENPTASIIVYSGRKNAFLPRPETRQGCSFSLSFNIMLEILAPAIRQGKKIKSIHWV